MYMMYNQVSTFIFVFRQQMESALEKLRNEVGSLQREEQTKLEEEKRKCLENLQHQVTDIQYLNRQVTDILYLSRQVTDIQY